MLNKILYFLFCLIIYFLACVKVYSNEEFNFNITEIQISEDGNKITGSKGGNVITDNGIVISAENFNYDKTKNILKAFGSVKVEDKKENYIIISEDITYIKNQETILSKGKTTANIYSRYNLESSDLIFSRKFKILESKKKTIVKDEINKILYSLEKFNFLLVEEVLKGEKILVSLDYNLPQNDKLFFENGMFDLKNKTFAAKDFEFKFKKDGIFNEDNDPRLKGLSATSENDITIINKGIFTSCGYNDNCPPWAISANKIIHDKNKKQMIYEDALLKIYNIPVFYFPKFFHPDPTVKRQSGLLIPRLSNSNILGTSITLPYYHVISDNKDYTLRSTIFDSDVTMLQNEYRQVNKNSSLFVDFGYIDGYKPSTSNKKNSRTHLFANYNADLDLEDFITSNLFVSIQKVSNDTYLKIFDGNLLKNEVTPSNYDILESEAKLTLNHEDFNFSTGIQSFENLKLPNSDRYQFILPYYNFSKRIFDDFKNGFINFSSKGSNELNDTNNLKTKVINDLNFDSLNFISDIGFNNNFSLNFKNLNTIGKNDSKYKSSPQVELMSIIEYQSSLPLIKETDKNINYLTPKMSLRFNPGDMKNSNDLDRSINTDNIFDLNRLGLDDSFEEGKSLTIGLDYKKTSLENINKFFETRIATVLRDKEESFIPASSGIDKKDPNIFGSINNSFSEFFSINYDFIIDNDLQTLKYNQIDTSFNYKNFSTEFNYIEENNPFGNSNSIENKTTLKINDKNYLSFNTRRNRKIDLTEYYNLVYEYKNDCLVAGLKYNKTYYEDRDVRPSENLLFTITLSPLTSLEQKVDQ